MKIVKKIFRGILSIIFWIAIISLVLSGLYRYVLEPFVVSGESMANTLHSGEGLFMFKTREIEQFDVVVFESPGDPNVLYIKRVIGMPGDHIAFAGDSLYLNGQALEEPYLEPLKSEWDYVFTEDFTLEEVAQVNQVPEGHYFVLGDNRQNSLDGRDFGVIDEGLVIGEADWVVWPLSDPDQSGALSNLEVLTKWELNDSGTAIIKR